VSTDADPAITGAIENIWHGTKHHFCLFHIRKNLEKHFLSKFGREKFRNFFSSFCQARNSTTEAVFEKKWQQVLDLFPEAQSYFRRQLYPHREAWSQFVRFNETNGELPRVMNASYRDHYFIAIDEACTKFLTPAIQKLQQNQMDQCSHYRAYHTNLEVELQQAHVENVNELDTPKGMFSEDLYDETLIELIELVDGISDIRELWIVSRIDQQRPMQQNDY
ncbi:9854_t:CDS:2, partial [Racocetra fulgida]